MSAQVLPSPAVEPAKPVGVVEYVRTLTDEEKELLFDELLRDAARVRHQHDTPPASPQVIEDEVAARRERILAKLDRLTPEDRTRGDKIVLDLRDTFDPIEWNEKLSRENPD